MTSEVARVLAQIDLEIEAFRRLFHDPAQVASHAAIERRMDALGSCHEELRTLVPAEEAAQTLITVMNTVADAARSHPDQQTEPAPEHPSIESSTEQRAKERSSTMPQPLTPAPETPRATNQQLIMARQRRQWSKKETARRLGISSVIYSAWETGRHEPTLPHLRALCQLFASPPERLGFPVYLPEQQVQEITADPSPSLHETQTMHETREKP